MKKTFQPFVNINKLRQYWTVGAWESYELLAVKTLNDIQATHETGVCDHTCHILPFGAFDLSFQVTILGTDDPAVLFAVERSRLFRQQLLLVVSQIFEVGIALVRSHLDQLAWVCSVEFVSKTQMYRRNRSGMLRTGSAQNDPRWRWKGIYQYVTYILIYSWFHNGPVIGTKQHLVLTDRER